MVTKTKDKERLEKALVKYQVAISKNISESEILWTRYSALLVFNTILITGIGFSYQSEESLPHLLELILPIAGLLVCYTWFMMTLRGFNWIGVWIKSANRLEKKYLIDEELILNPVLYGDDVRRKDMSIFRTKVMSLFLIIIVALMYLLFLYFQG